MRMLCIAARHDPIGYVAVNRVGLDLAAISRMTGGSLDEVRSLTDELERNGVFTRDRNGTIFNRRMIRDAKRQAEGRKYGKLGGNPSLRKERGNGATLKGRDKAHAKGGHNPLSISLSKDDLRSSGKMTLTAHELQEKLTAASNNHISDSASALTLAPIISLIENDDCDLERHILPAVRKRVPNLGRPLQSWGAGWLRAAILELRDADRRTVAATSTTNGAGRTVEIRGLAVAFTNIELAVRKWQGGGWWNVAWGDPPGEPGCLVPWPVLQELGVAVHA